MIEFNVIFPDPKVLWSIGLQDRSRCLLWWHDDWDWGRCWTACDMFVVRIIPAVSSESTARYWWKHFARTDRLQAGMTRWP